MIAAALANPIVRALLLMAAGALLVAGIWWHGYRTAAGACEADQLRTELEAARRDLAAKRDVELRSSQALAAAAGELATITEGRDVLAHKYASLARAGGCVLPDDLRRSVQRPGGP